MDILIQKAGKFFKNPPNAGHAKINIEENKILDEIRAGLQSGNNTADRSLQLIEGNELKVIEIGCSWGPLVFGAAASDRVASVVGIEIEKDAIELGNQILASDLIEIDVKNKVSLVNSPAESLPFDLVICHTVIEHVMDVYQVMQEMCRVLKPNGVIHLEAPNYIWPYEPHVGIYMLPMGPKWLAKFIAKNTGKDPELIDQLRFINAFRIEAILGDIGFQWTNLYLNKIKAILLDGEYQRVLGYQKVIPVIKFLRATRLTRVIIFVINKLRFYPSIEYKIYRVRR